MSRMLITCSQVSTEPQSVGTIILAFFKNPPPAKSYPLQIPFPQILLSAMWWCVVMALEIQLLATGLVDQCFRGPSVLIKIQTHLGTFKRSWGDVASGRVLVTKQTKHFCAKAINIFMEFRTPSSNGRILIRHFRSVSLRGVIKGQLGILMNQFLTKTVNGQGA